MASIIQLKDSAHDSSLYPITDTRAVYHDGERLSNIVNNQTNDFLNLNSVNDHPQPYDSSTQARTSVGNTYREKGLCITYLDKDSSLWIQEQFIGDSSTSGWTTPSNWQTLGPVSVSQNTSTGHIDITVGSNTTPVASVEESGINSMAIDGKKALCVSGKFIYQDGSIRDASGYSITPYIPVKEGDRFVVNVGGGNSATRPIVLYDSSKTIVSIIDYRDTTNYTYIGYLVIPNGVSYVVFGNNDVYSGNYLYKFSIGDDIWKTIVDNLDYSKIFIQENKFIFANGSIGESVGYYITDYIPVTQGDKFLIQVGGGNSAIRPIALFNSSKEFVSVVNYNELTNYKYSGLLVIPENISYLLVSNRNTTFTTPIVKKLSDYEYNAFVNVAELVTEVTSQRQDIITLTKRLNNVESIEDNLNGINFSLDDCELIGVNKFINNQKDIIDYNGAKVYRYKFTNPDFVSILLTAVNLTYPNGLCIYDDDTYEVLSNSSSFYSNLGLIVPDGKQFKYLYVNVYYNTNNEQIGGITQFKLRAWQRSYIMGDGKEYIDCSNIIYKNKYLNDSGELVSLGGWALAKITYDYRYDYFCNGTLQFIGGVYDADDNYLGAVRDFIVPWSAGSPGKSLFPIGATYMLVIATRHWWRIPRKEDYRRIHHYLQKPFTFSGKSAVFFGDSITDGFVSVPGGSQYHDRNKAWPKLLCDRLGMTCNNQGIGGSALTEYGSQYTSGVKLICGPDGTRVDITEDFIFIAHGTNDWTSNIPIGKVTDLPEDWEHATTFFGALNLIAQKIKTDYPTKTVIFVLPIWRAQYGDFKYSLDIYREAICDVAFRNNFNVIDGSEFGFECGSDLLIADKTHPTELGYIFYSNQMYDRLV